MTLANWWFRPTYQPNRSNVEFHLKPLSQKALSNLKASLNENLAPSWDALVDVFRSNVIDWKDLPAPCTNEEKAKILTSAVGEFRWTVWLEEIAGDLYRRAILSEADRGNSESPSTSPSTPSG